jgi:hypothetical protein
MMMIPIGKFADRNIIMRAPQTGTLLASIYFKTS